MKGLGKMECSHWIVDRTPTQSSRGMVATKTSQASSAGAEVLRDGGNAVDAAVTSAFVAGVAEPWMSGIGGGGFLVRHDPRNDSTDVVAFPMIAGTNVSPEMYRLTSSKADEGLFGWPEVEGAENMIGPRSICVPGTVAGLSFALESFGSIDFASAVAPAAELARRGVPVSWHTTLEIARDLTNLNRFPATAAAFCPEGVVPWTSNQDEPALIRHPELAQTLDHLATHGPRAFYEGEIAQSIVEHLQDQGAPVTAHDFATYQVRLEEPVTSAYNGASIYTTGNGSGGTTLGQSMSMLDRLDIASFSHNDPAALHQIAQVYAMTFADRFAYLADPDKMEVPLEAMLSNRYHDERVAQITMDTVSTPTSGTRAQLGITHDLQSSVPDFTSDGSTTHISVIDADGVAVSLTVTLLSLWGSRVTVPGTGVLMNDGMMWFDPEPGRPNSIEGGKRPLSNMAPAILTGPDSSVAALGASGGRRIMNCVSQLAMNLIDHSMGLQEAISAPRIDRSTSRLLASDRIPVATTDWLKDHGHPVALRDETAFLGEFASPACVSRSGDLFAGGVDPWYFPATAVGIE